MRGAGRAEHSLASKLCHPPAAAYGLRTTDYGLRLLDSPSLFPDARCLVPRACPADFRPGYSLPVTIKKICATFSRGFLARRAREIAVTVALNRRKKNFALWAFSNNLQQSRFLTKRRYRGKGSRSGSAIGSRSRSVIGRRPAACGPSTFDIRPAFGPPSAGRCSRFGIHFFTFAAGGGRLTPAWRPGIPGRSAREHSGGNAPWPSPHRRQQMAERRRPVSGLRRRAAASGHSPRATAPRR